MTEGTDIAGYDYGKPASARSPLSLEEMRQLEASTGWTEADAAVLQKHARIFDDHAEEMVDSWRSVIGSQPHLAKWFFGPDGKPDEQYKAWLDYQEEIGLRHTPEKKNRTDLAQTAPVVPLTLWSRAYCKEGLW